MKYFVWNPLICFVLFWLCFNGCTTPVEFNLSNASQNKSDQALALSKSSLTKFVAGQIILTHLSPGALDKIKTKYHLDVIDRISLSELDYYLLALDLDQIEAVSLNELKKNTSKITSQTINMEFLTSIEARKTWQVYLELLKEKLNVELNYESEPSLTSLIPGDLKFNLNSALEGWWLKRTQVLEAWNYSIATDIRVAYIDQGFKHHQEIERRLILNGHNNQTREYRDKEPNNIEVPEGTHGISTLLVGFAERDNGRPSVGVAPNALVTPYVAGNLWEVSLAIQHAIVFGSQVIGVNWVFARPSLRVKDEQIVKENQLLKDVIDLAINQYHIPVIVPAHNYGEPISGGVREWYPASIAEQPSKIVPGKQIGLIVVGGAMINGKREITSWFNPNLYIGEGGRGSNFGENIIWAPAVFLDIADADDSQLSSSQINGTSVSCPFITGTVALMKAVSPDITPAEIKATLIETSIPIDASQSFGFEKQVPFVQVKNSIESILLKKGLNLRDFQPTLFSSGYIKKVNKKRYLQIELRTYELIETLSNMDRYTEQLVNVKGWLRANEKLEVLSVDFVGSGGSGR